MALITQANKLFAGQSTVLGNQSGQNVSGSGAFVSANSSVSGSQNSNAVTPSLIASRTSGPAPLAVHFDAVGTTSTNVLDPFRQCLYTFDYGDPASGTWAHGNPSYNSKNSDVGGPLGAHVFETPGTYVVTVTVNDGVGSSSTTVTITVNDPDTFFAGADTICVNDSGTNDGLGPSGCVYASAAPTGAAAVGKRILFRRGQTTVRDTGSMVSNQWTHYGAYGTGSKPIIQPRSFSTDSVAGTVFRDVRFNAGIQIYSSEFLFLRCDFSSQRAFVSICNRSRAITAVASARSIW